MSKLSDQNVNSPFIETKPKVALGVIGAIIGALLGAAAWVGLYQLDVIASAAGIAIIYLSCKGYSLLSKSNHLQGVIISGIISVIVLLVAHVFCWGLAIYAAFSPTEGITLFEAILNVPVIAFTEEFIVDFVKELLIGLVLIGLGIAPFIKSAAKNREQQAA